MHNPDATRSLPRIAVDMRALVGTPSGIGFYTQSLLVQLAKLQTARYTGVSHRPITDPNTLQDTGVNLESHGGPLGVWWQQLILPDRLHRGDFDLFWSPITILPVRLPIPAVVTIHDLTTLLHPETHRIKVRLSVLPFLGKTITQARRIAVDSKATADDVRRHYPACTDRLEVVYPGIDPEFRPASGEAIAAFRREIGCDEGFILYAGTLEPRKNLHALLTAWERLRLDRPATPPLILTGPYGWRSRDLLHRIESLQASGLQYLGRVPRHQLVQLMQAATLFVYPSLYEGFGLPPAEAMACGTPVVTSNRSSLPEVVGETGLLVDPEDTEALASAIQRLLDEPDLAADLGEQGLHRSTRFTWQRAAEAMESLFVEALS